MQRTLKLFAIVLIIGLLCRQGTIQVQAKFCEPNLSGDWPITTDCVIYENTNGAAAGNINLSLNSTVTLHNGKTLVWYPGKSITIATGSHIIVNTGAKIDQTLLCLRESGVNANYGSGTTSVDQRTGQTLYLGLDQTPASSTTTSADGTILGQYGFENCSGTTISDMIGANHGTLTLGAGGTTSAGTCSPVAGAWGAGVTGRIGSSISFDGVDDYVSIPNNRSADTIASVAFWYKANRVGNGGTGSFSADLIQHTNFTNSGYWIEWHNNGSLELSVAGQAGIVSTTIATTVDTSSWHHVAITVSSNGTSTAYFDGKLSNTMATGNWTNYTGNLLIGSGSGGTNNASAFNQNFGGKIDDLRVYTRALNANEVGNLASMPNPISKYCGVGYKPRETFVNIGYVDAGSAGATGSLATLYRDLLNWGFYIYNNITQALVTTREVAATGNVVRVIGDNLQLCVTTPCTSTTPATYGNLVVESGISLGTTTPSVIKGQLDIISTGTGDPRSIVNEQYSSDASGAQINNFKARNTLASPQGVSSGDIIFNLNGRAYNSTTASFIQAASVQGVVDGTPGASDMPGRLAFNTTNAGSASPTEKMRISNAGNVGIGTTNPTTKLEISDLLAGYGDSSLLINGGSPAANTICSGGLCSVSATKAYMTVNANGQSGTSTPYGYLGYIYSGDGGVGASYDPIIAGVAGRTVHHTNSVSYQDTPTGVYGTVSHDAGTTPLLGDQGWAHVDIVSGVRGEVSSNWNVNPSIYTGSKYYVSGVYGQALTGGTAPSYGGVFINSGNATTQTGIYATATGGTNNYAAIFDQGNVGIGTSAPTAKLDINSSTGEYIERWTRSGAVLGDIYKNTNSQLTFESLANGSTLAGFRFSGTGTTTFDQGGSIYFPHSLQTDTNDGRIGAALFDVGLNIVGIQTVAAGGRQIRYWGTMSQSSDARYKNVNYIYSGSEILEKLMKIKPVNYDWKENNPINEVGKNQVGLLAQDVEQVYPELVINGKAKSLNYIGIIPLLVGATNKLNERVESLTLTINSQQTQIEELKKELLLLR